MVITGASSGPGEGMAHEFAAMGRDLARCACRIERLEAPANLLRAKYPAQRFVVCALDDTDARDVHARFVAFQRELDKAFVPAWPWAMVARALRLLAATKFLGTQGNTAAA